MGNRDRDQRDLALDRVDVLERLLTAALSSGLAQCEFLRSECVKRSIQIEKLITDLRATERQVGQRDRRIAELEREVRRMQRESSGEV